MKTRLDILIADDDLAHRVMLKKLLSGWGYNVAEADDGSVAVDEVRKRSFDLILMDIRMMNVSGIEALEQIKQINPKIIVTLGKFATSFLLGDKTGIMKLRGQLFEREGRLIYPLLHPSALLHNSQWKRPTWEDLKNLKKILEKMNFYTNPQESL